MKRIITILTLILVLAGTAFATGGGKLFITVTLGKKVPNYSILGILDDTPNLVVVGSAQGSTITSSADPSTTDIVLHVRIVQTSKSIYQDMAGVNLTITPTALGKVGDAQNHNTGNPTIDNIVAGVANNNYLTVTATATPVSANDPDLGNDHITFLCQYAGHPIPANTVIGTFDYTWHHNDNLPIGSYEATVTMTYTTH